MNDRQRIILTRIVTGSVLLLLSIRFLEHATLSGLSSPTIFSVEPDITYWLYRMSPLPSLLVENPAGAILFDILLFLTGILSFLFPLRRFYIISFSILLMLYALSYNLYATHHLGQLYGYIIVLLPFWVGNNYKFGLVWEGMRYFTCLVYSLAFWWKTVWGDSFYDWQHGVSSFKSNLVDYITLNPDTIMTAIYRWLLRHDWILNAGDKGIMLLEGLMVIGFFTKKYDRLLIWLPVIIHVSTYFFSDVFFIELLPIDLSLLSLTQLDRIGRLFSQGEMTPMRR